MNRWILWNACIKSLPMAIALTGLSFAHASEQAIFLDVDFDDLPTGTLSHKHYEKHWGDGWGIGLEEGNAVIIDGSEAYEGKSMRIRIKQGHHEGIKWRTPVGAHEKFYFSYNFKFWDDWDMTEHGKLPALYGYKNPNDGQTAYKQAWRTGPHFGDTRGRLHSYTYDADRRAYAIHWDEESGKFVPGKWHFFECMVKLNTGSNTNGRESNADGIIQAWLDGEEVAHKRDVRFYRSIRGSDIRFAASVFISGGVANQDEYVYLDNVLVSKNRIGVPTKRIPPSTPRGVTISTKSN